MPLYEYKSLIYLILLLVSGSSTLAFRYTSFLFLKCTQASHLTLLRLSALLWLVSCTTSFWPASFVLKTLNIHQTMIYVALIPANQTLFSWGLDIIFNALPSPVYVLSISSVHQSPKPVCNPNLILFPILWLIKLPQVKSLPIEPLCGLFTHCQSFPNLCNHQIVICITISSSKTSHIPYLT